jgi:hypothetical protein
MTGRLAILALVLVPASLLAAQPSLGQAAAPPRSSLHVVSLNDFTIGGRRFLGRTPAQVTALFGKPAARVASRTALDLRYGGWTIHFARRKSDGKLLGASATSVDPGLYGARGRRLLATWFGPRGIGGAVTSEIGWVENGDWNEWIPRAGGYDGLDFPRRISWGIDAKGRRWLRIATQLDVEFRGP